MYSFDILRLRDVTVIIVSCGRTLTGTGSTSDALVPATIDSLFEIDIVQIATGHSHTLALTADGQVFSWGKNDVGKLLPVGPNRICLWMNRQRQWRGTWWDSLYIHNLIYTKG